MILLTGDKHGNAYDIKCMTDYLKRFNLTSSDYIIILGDFGLGWKGSKEDSYYRIVDTLNTIGATILFIDGNHENFDFLGSFPVKQWHGGKVHFLEDNIIHLMRGQVFNIDDKEFFTFGGAKSIDITGGIFEVDDPYIGSKIEQARLSGLPYRVNHLSWWKEEMPSEKEFKEGINNLKKVNNKVDYILTHCAPTSCIRDVGIRVSGTPFKPDECTDMLEQYNNKIMFNKWCFGHYHSDFNLYDKFRLLYDDLIEA